MAVRRLHIKGQGSEELSLMTPATDGSAELRRLDELDVESDDYVFADENAAGFEGRVPGQSEVLAVDFGGGCKADTRIAPGILAQAR